MKRVQLDTEAPAVQQFIRSLARHPEGVELELGGSVLCKLIPALQFSEVEKAALLSEGRELVRRARERNQGVPARVIEREVRAAVAAVRRRAR
jgi:hypothetical protein